MAVFFQKKYIDQGYDYIFKYPQSSSGLKVNSMFFCHGSHWDIDLFPTYRQCTINQLEVYWYSAKLYLKSNTWIRWNMHIGKVKHGNNKKIFNHSLFPIWLAEIQLTYAHVFIIWGMLKNKYEESDGDQSFYFEIFNLRNPLPTAVPLSHLSSNSGNLLLCFTFLPTFETF